MNLFLSKHCLTWSWHKNMLKQAVNIYNKQRRHYSLEMKTPEFAHRNQQHEYKYYSLN
jgi:hypothetical protein